MIEQSKSVLLVFGLHWLEMTYWGLGDGCRYSVDSFCEDWGRPMGWDVKGITSFGASGIKVIEDGQGAARGYVRVQVPGEVCAGLGESDCCALVHRLAQAAKVNVTRCDWAWDCVPFSPGAVRRWCNAGYLVSRHFKKDRDLWWEGSPTGSTTYLGHRDTNELQLRCYDRRGPTRLELELRGKYSRRLWSDIVEDCKPEDLERKMRGVLLSIVDFRQGGSVNHPGRGERVAGWADFMGDTRVVRIPRDLPKRDSSAVQRVRWLIDNHSATLLLIRGGMGYGMLDSQLVAAELAGKGPSAEDIGHVRDAYADGNAPF
jgi:hypothetical protein